MPFKVAAVEAMYPLPEMVSVCEGEPAGTLPGEIDLIVGAGLSAGVTGVGAVGVGVEEMEFPLQPVNRVKVKAEPTKSKVPSRTSAPKIRVVPENDQRRNTALRGCLGLLLSYRKISYYWGSAELHSHKSEIEKSRIHSGKSIPKVKTRLPPGLFARHGL